MDAADRARAGPHDERFSRGARAAVADALQDVAVGDAGGREEDVLPRAEIIGSEDPVEVVASIDRGGALLVVARPETAQHLAAHRLQCGSREDSLRRAADPPEQVDRRAVADRE